MGEYADIAVDHALAACNPRFRRVKSPQCRYCKSIRVYWRADAYSNWSLYGLDGQPHVCPNPTRLDEFPIIA